jgi:ribose transport system substrate-binding protein
MSQFRTARSTAAVAAALAMLSTAACASNSSSGDSSEEKLKFGLVLGLNTNASYQSMYCGAKDAASELGNIDVSFNGTAGFSAAEEVPILNAFVRTKPDGVIVVPSDPNGMQAPMEQVVKKDIPLVTADIAPSKPVGLTAIGPDNTEGGRQAAEFLADKMDHEGTVYVNSYIPGTSVDTERVGGFKEYMKANEPDITVLPVDYSKAEPKTAAQQTAAALRAHPEINGLYGQNELTAVGMATAVREAGKDGKIPFVAYDADETQVRALKDGTFDALVSQGFYFEGYEAVKLLAKVARNEVDEADVEEKTESPIKLLTADNVDDEESKPFIYTKCE